MRLRVCVCVCVCVCVKKQQNEAEVCVCVRVYMSGRHKGKGFTLCMCVRGPVCGEGAFVRGKGLGMAGKEEPTCRLSNVRRGRGQLGRGQ